MTVYKEISRRSTLKHKVEVNCTMWIPDLDADATQAPAMGKEASEKKEALEKFAEELWGPQYFHAMRQNIVVYEKSKLPIRFLQGQKVVIKPLYEAYGYFSETSGIIIFDNDAICGIRRMSGEFLFGHELGHKMLHVKESKKLIKEAARVLMVTNNQETLLKELIADEVGNLITGEITDRELFGLPIEEGKRKIIQREILKFAWQ